MRSKIGTICMLLGTGLIVAALSLLFWNQREDKQAGEAVEQVLPQVIQQIEKNIVAPEEGSGYPDPYDPAMTETEIDGCAYIGYLSIPAIELELPVMAAWDYKRLKIAPCRYTGSAKTDDFVLCAHNYDQHFGPIRNLVQGDDVFFTDMDGVLWHYRVSEVGILEATDIGEMTAGTCGLTLFTCTYGGVSRVTVRCGRVETE